MRNNFQWPKSQFEKNLDKFLNRVKKEFVRGIEWLFFYNKKDTMDAVFHIFDVMCLLYISWRLFT